MELNEPKRFEVGVRSKGKDNCLYLYFDDEVLRFKNKVTGDSSPGRLIKYLYESDCLDGRVRMYGMGADYSISMDSRYHGWFCRDFPYLVRRVVNLGSEYSHLVLAGKFGLLE